MGWDEEERSEQVVVLVPDLDLPVLWLLNYVASQSVALALYPGSFFMWKGEMSLGTTVLPHDINQLFISRGSHLYVM